MPRAAPQSALRWPGLIPRSAARYSYDAPRVDGVIHLEQAALYLPLEAGGNELIVVVTDEFGGWGLMGRFADSAGLRLEAR